MVGITIFNSISCNMSVYVLRVCHKQWQAKKTYLLTGRKLEQDQAHKGGGEGGR